MPAFYSLQLKNGLDNTPESGILVAGRQKSNTAVDDFLELINKRLNKRIYQLAVNVEKVVDYGHPCTLKLKIKIHSSELVGRIY